MAVHYQLPYQVRQYLINRYPHLRHHTDGELVDALQAELHLPDDVANWTLVPSQRLGWSPALISVIHLIGAYESFLTELAAESDILDRRVEEGIDEALGA